VCRRIAKYVLGSCLILSALLRPEVGRHLPGYLADFLLRDFAGGTVGVVWLLMALAGVCLFCGYRLAGFLACVACVYNLAPQSCKFSFVPLLPELLETMGVGAIKGPIVAHAANLGFAFLVLGVEMATAAPQSVNVGKATLFRLLAIFAVGLASALAVIVPVAVFAALFLRDPPLLADLLSRPLLNDIQDYLRLHCLGDTDNLYYLLFVGGPIFAAGLVGVIASCRRLTWMVVAHWKTPTTDRDSEASRLSERIADKKAGPFPFSRRTLFGGTLVAGVVLIGSVATWRDAHDPLRYDRRFHDVVRSADRIVVRDGGFDCCGPVDGQKVLFEVTEPAEIAEVLENLHVAAERPSDGCMCCGYPGIDWYRGRKRIALTSVQHLFRLRWRGFSGDACLTDESAQWLHRWFTIHGMDDNRLR
jgi:hypothetical protein